KYLTSLPPGITELMCHPGYAAENRNPFSSLRRQDELNALTHPDILRTIEKNGIILCSYGELRKHEQAYRKR
ncbi:MAG: hypothetical protein GY868_04100, partial [Deltaproteobacteria bacterium]|nr:hypothetical protein [Deltaproteobacteria bacterium]